MAKFVNRKNALERSQLAHKRLHRKYLDINNNSKIGSKRRFDSAVKLFYHQELLTSQSIDNRIYRNSEKKDIYDSNVSYVKTRRKHGYD